VDGLGEDEKTGAILNNMAIVLTNEGKLDRAEESYRRAKKHFELAGNVGNTATALGNLADIAYLRGDLARAEKLYQQALQIQMRLDPSRPGYMLYRLADLELNEGKVREAELHAQQATAALQKEQGSYQYLTTAMDELGEVVEARGDLAQARDLFEQSLALRLKTAEQGMVAESHVELAEINLEQGKPDGAEPLLRSATAEFDREHSDPDSSAAYTLLSRALLAQGRFDDARAAARRGSALSLTSQDPVLRLSAVIQGARVDAAFASKDGQKKQLPAAMQELNAASAEAQRKGYVTLSYEARLALGELELKHNMPAGRAHLQTLAVDARGRGLSLLAEQAERVLGSAGNVVAARTTNH
jgi:Flp pilus assembly protein TadD